MKIKALFLFLILFSSVKLNAQSIDLRILESINTPVNPGADRTWNFITDKSLIVDVAMPVSMVIIGFANNDEQLKLNAYKTGASLLIAGGASFILKKITKRERPYIRYPDLIIGKAHETDYSFPSAHVSLAFSTATSLSLAFPKWYVIAPSFIYAGVVSYSRLYLGVHYPSDVLAGAILGAGSSYITWKAQKWLSGKKHNKADQLKGQ